MHSVLDRYGITRAPTKPEQRALNRALSVGWEIGDVHRRLDTMNPDTVDNPHGWAMALITNMALEDPYAVPIASEEGMSPAVEWTPELDAEVHAEWLERTRRDGAA